MKKYILVYGWSIFFLGYFFQTTSIPVQALVKVPLCDLVGDCGKATEYRNNAVIYYNNLPLCGQRIEDCSRMHQLLYNEIVTILEEKGDECLVKVSSIFYQNETNAKKHDTYWALRKNFITFPSLAKLGISYDVFPNPLDYAKDVVATRKKIVTLVMPFYESKTKQHFSAGTRFVMVPAKGHRFGHSVYLFDARNNQLITTIIPFALCRIENSKETFQQKVNEFIALLRRWTSQEGFIPYVWGGSSFSKVCKKDEFVSINSGNGGYYHRTECSTEFPKNGFDCTGLIARAAQICGLSYYFKNSITIKKNLAIIDDYQKLREGDILWIPGHVMVVASLKKNTLIEARGYNHGYGKVHEIALNKVFQDVMNFGQLIELYKAKKPLKRLDSNGAFAHCVDSYLLLSLETIV